MKKPFVRFVRPEHIGNKYTRMIPKILIISISDSKIISVTYQSDK